MAQIYKIDNIDVYDSGGKTIDAKTGQEYVSPYRNPNADFNYGAEQPTVVASANINEKVIPDLNEKVKNMSQTGSFVDANGVERFADQKPVPEKDADAEFLKNLADFNRKFGRQPNDTTGIKKVAGGGIDTTGAFDEQGGVIGGTRKPTPQEEELDTAYNQNQTLIDQMKTSLDTSTKRQIDSIEAQFAVRKQQMEEINRRQQKGIEQTLLMGGSSRYAQLSSAGIVAGKERDSLMKIAELDAQEKELVNAALSAQETGNFKLLEKKIDLAETKRKEKQKEAETLSKAVAEENKRLREEKTKLDEVDRVRSIGDFVSDAISSGITDVNEIYRQARISGIKIDTKDIASAVKDLQVVEKVAPGIIGEWMSLKENAPEFKDLTLEEYLNMKDPTRALDIKEQQIRIKTMEKTLADKGLAEDPIELIGYQDLYEATGKIPTGLPKGTFGIIAKAAKESSKAKGTIVNTKTGVKDGKLSSPQQEDFAALYDIIQKIPRLKELDEKRIEGLTSATLGKIFGSEAQTEYLSLRKSIVDDIARMQTGAALTEDEQAFYNDYLPGRVGEVLRVLGRDTASTISNFEKIMNDRLENRSRANGLSVYGYSKVKIEDKEYKVGDTITNAKGEQGRILPDGSIVKIEE